MNLADFIVYGNQGATRNQPLSPQLVQALGFLPEMGLTAHVFSGGQPAIGTSDRRVGSTRHDDGGAADLFFYRGDERLDWRNPEHIPIFQEVVRRGREADLTGFGAGEGYMQPGSMHIGFGAPAVWGAGGSGANAPDWLREAFGAPTLGFSGSAAPRPGANPGLAAMFGQDVGSLGAGPVDPRLGLGGIGSRLMADRQRGQREEREDDAEQRRLSLIDMMRA